MDETTGDYKLGKKDDFQVPVYSKNKDGQVVRERVKVSIIIPEQDNT